MVSADWAAKCGRLKAQGPYRIMENTSPRHKEILECTGIVTFNVRYRQETSEVAAWVSTSIQSEILLGSKALTELRMGIDVVNQPDINRVADSLPPEPSVAPRTSTVSEPQVQGPFKAWCERQRRGESTDLTDEEGCWIPNKEWPETPKSVNWGRPSARSRIFYNGQGYVYTERDDPEITAGQFRQNNREIANEDRSVVLSDDDSSVLLTSSGALSDSDGHGDCGRGGTCPDDLDVARVLFSAQWWAYY